MAEKNLKDNRNLITPGRLDPQVERDRYKTPFTDGSLPGRADVGNFANRPVVKKDTSEAAIAASSPSKEYNPYNRLNHLEMICGMDVRYFITPSALTHMASIFRHIAFGDISATLDELYKEVERAKEENRKSLGLQIQQQIISQQTGEISTPSTAPKSNVKYTDCLNIPWKLVVPIGDVSEKIKDYENLTSSSLVDTLINESLAQEVSFPSTIEFDSGKEKFSCPKKPVTKGAFYIGTENSITRPIFIPIKAGAGYSGLFGKFYEKTREFLQDTISGSNTASAVNVLKSIAALASTRASFPSSLSDSESASLVSLPVISDYSNIISLPLKYSVKDGKSLVSYFDTNKPVESPIEIDDGWKNALSSGELFDSVTGTDYSESGLVDSSIIKPGTRGLKVSDLDEALFNVRDKITSPIFSRISANNPAKAGAAGAEAPAGVKKFEDFSNLKAKEYLREKSWSDILSTKLTYKTKWTGGIKNGTTIQDYSEIPSFMFWTPLISYSGKETDGSTVIGYAEPKIDNFFSKLQVLYSSYPPIAEIRMGVERVKWSKVFKTGSPESLKNSIISNIDIDIADFGYGDFIGQKYYLPISNLFRSVIGLGTLTGIFSDLLPKTHSVDNTEVSVYSLIASSIVRRIKNLSKANAQSLVLSDSSTNKLWTKSRNVNELLVSANSICLLGTDSESSSDGKTIDAFDEEGKIDKSESIGFLYKLVPGEIKKLKLHFGKEITSSTLEPLAAGVNIDPADLMVKSKVKKTAIFNPDDYSMVLDIQPGESIRHTFGSDGKRTITYVPDPFNAVTSIEEDELVSQDFSKRPNAVDIISSFASVKATNPVQNIETQTTANSQQVKGYTEDLTSSASSINSIINIDSKIGSLSSGIFPSYIEKQSVANNNAAAPNTGVLDKYSSSSLLGDFVFSLISNSHFYQELISDNKVSSVSTVGVNFVTGTQVRKEKKLARNWFSLAEDNSVLFDQNVSESEKIEVEYMPSHLSFSPWEGFLKGQLASSKEAVNSVFEIGDPSIVSLEVEGSLNFSFDILFDIFDQPTSSIVFNFDSVFSQNNVATYVSVSTNFAYFSSYIKNNYGVSDSLSDLISNFLYTKLKEKASKFVIDASISSIPSSLSISSVDSLYSFNNIGSIDINSQAYLPSTSGNPYVSTKQKVDALFASGNYEERNPEQVSKLSDVMVYTIAGYLMVEFLTLTGVEGQIRRVSELYDQLSNLKEVDFLTVPRYEVKTAGELSTFLSKCRNLKEDYDITSNKLLSIIDSLSIIIHNFILRIIVNFFKYFNRFW